MLTVASLGYAVPANAFAGTVHSVFARACNIAFDGGLLTLGVPPFSAGPATLVLDGGSVCDLRSLFRVGERIEWSRDRARSPRVTIDFAHARRWRPSRRRPSLSPPRIAANLRAVTRMLRGRSRGDLAGDMAAPRLRLALADACRVSNPLRAEALARRLIGRGAGLTPSGDDFLVGLCAGLDVRAGRRAEGLCARLGALLIAEQLRTTDLAAQQLQLAAFGQFNEDLLLARNALTTPHLRGSARAALTRLLAAGASSGAAACEGLRAGLSAGLAGSAR